MNNDFILNSENISIFEKNGVVLLKNMIDNKWQRILHDAIEEAYNNEEIICIFQPHRISRLKDLRKEFSLSFKKANSVVLCPVYSAGEKLKLGFNYFNYAKEIINNSKVKVFVVKDQYQLARFIKQNIYGKKIVIGMGAGSISSWIRELPNLI